MRLETPCVLDKGLLVYMTSSMDCWRGITPCHATKGFASLRRREGPIGKNQRKHTCAVVQGLNRLRRENLQFTMKKMNVTMTSIHPRRHPRANTPDKTGISDPPNLPARTHLNLFSLMSNHRNYPYGGAAAGWDYGGGAPSSSSSSSAAGTGGWDSTYGGTLGGGGAPSSSSSSGSAVPSGWDSTYGGTLGGGGAPSSSSGATGSSGYAEWDMSYESGGQSPSSSRYFAYERNPATLLPLPLPVNPRTAQQQEMAALRAENARLAEQVSSMLIQLNRSPPIAGPTTSYEYGANKENTDPACLPTRRACDNDHASWSSSSSSSALPPLHFHTGSSTMPVASLAPTYNNPQAGWTGPRGYDDDHASWSSSSSSASSSSALPPNHLHTGSSLEPTHNNPQASAGGAGPRGLLGGGNVGGYHGASSSSPAANAAAGTSLHFQHHGLLGGKPSFMRKAMNTTRGGTVGGGGVGQPTHHRGVLGGGFVETPAQATMSFTVPHALGVDNARGSSTASGNNAQPPASSSSSYGRTAPENSEDEGDFNK